MRSADAHLRLKGPFPFPFPQHQRLIPFFAAQLGRDGEKRPVKCGAVIVGEFD